ncbi:MAG: PAS domain S-box protein [Bacteroidales bacterium]|nr:PAS domain S-box protein [Bacteroidales bacterium]
MKLFNVYINKQDSVQQIRKRLLYIILFLLTALGTPVLIIAGVEAYMLKQFSTILIYVLFFIPVLLVTIFRKQLKYKYIVYVVLFFCEFIAVNNIVIYGFGGAGIPIFFSLFVLTTIFLDQKSALIMILISALSMCIIGFLYVKQHIVLDVSLDEISTKPISWITAISVVVFLGALIIISNGLIQSKMLHSIKLAKKKADELNITNEKLRKDIQERIKIELELKESEVRFSSIVEQSGDSIYMFDFEGNILAVNKKACKTLAYERNELIKLNITDIVTKFNNKNDLRDILNNIQSGESYTIETNHKNINGIIFPVEVTFGLYEYSNIKSILGLARDISKRKQIEKQIEKLNKELEQRVLERTIEVENKSKELENTKSALLNIVEDLNEKSFLLEESTKKLEKANKELEAFTYSVSHDLKAPLRGIDGYSKLLLELYSDKLNQEAQTFISNIRSGTMQMNQLIEDLLAYSRLERSNMQNREIDIRRILDNIIANYYEEITSRNIKIVNDVKKTIIFTDYNGLAMVIRNLIGNAIKFTKKIQAPVININFIQTSSYWELIIQDNGIGFKMAYHDKIFEIFHRLHNVEDYPGTGIGLALVKKAINRMGGTIRAESEINSGAKFFIKLPKNINYE